MNAKYFAIAVALGIFIFVVELIRRQKMSFRYSLFWLSACLVVLVFSIWDKLLHKIASIAGFELASNFIFFLLLAFFTAMSLLLTLYINEQNDRTQSLAQSISILQHQIKKLENELERKNTSGSHHSKISEG